MCNSSPKSFWHQGPVSWKTIFPCVDPGVLEEMVLGDSSTLHFLGWWKLYLQLLPRASITASAPPHIFRHYICIRSAQPRHGSNLSIPQQVGLDPVHVQFTVGLALLRESKATTDLTGGRAQAVMWVTQSDCKYRWSFTCSPPAVQPGS